MALSQKEIRRLISMVKVNEKKLRKALMRLDKNGTPVYWRRGKGDRDGTIEVITTNLAVADKEGCGRAFLS